MPDVLLEQARLIFIEMVCRQAADDSLPFRLRVAVKPIRGRNVLCLFRRNNGQVVFRFRTSGTHIFSLQEHFFLREPEFQKPCAYAAPSGLFNR